MFRLPGVCVRAWALHLLFVFGHSAQRSLLNVDRIDVDCIDAGTYLYLSYYIALHNASWKVGHTRNPASRDCKMALWRVDPGLLKVPRKILFGKSFR